MTGWPLLRLWLLAALRRPLRASVLVLALVVISTTTVAALVAADGLSGMFARDARAEWQTVDVEGRALQGSVFPDSVGRYLVSKAGPDLVAGAPRLALPAAVTAGDRTEQGLALGLGAEESAFPALAAVAGGADVTRTRSDEVLLNSRLARRLHVGVGDRVEVVVAVPEWREQRAQLADPVVHRPFAARLSLRVAGVVKDTGTADLHRTPNVLMSRSVLQRATHLEPASSTVLDLQLREPGRDAAKAFLDELDPLARRTGVALQPVKEDALDTAAGEGGLFRSILLTLALLVVASAAGGTVQLVLSLLRERMPEVAYLRAAGAPRTVLTRAVVLEVTGYGVAGALLGGALAVPVSGVLAGALSRHLASLDAGRGRETVALSTSVRPATVVTGVLLVLLVAAATGRSAARRALAADPELLLRGDLAGGGAPAATGLRRPVSLLTAGALCIGAGTGVPALLYLGVTLVLVAWWVWRRRVDGEVDRLAALLGLVWAVAGAALLGDFSQGVQAGFGVITVAGLVAVVCACVLVVPHLRRVMRTVRSYAARGPAQLALLSAGARAQRDAGRSGLAAGVVAGAYFGVVALAVLGSAAALPPDRQGGGFTAIGTAVAGVDPAALAAAAPAARSVVAVPHAQLPERAYRTEDPDGRRGTVPYPVRLVAAEADLVSTQQWGLADALPQYRTAREALTAVIADGDKAVVDRFARPEGAQPGDDVVLDLGAGPRRFRLVAVLDTFLLDGVLVSDSAFRDTGLAHGDTLVLASGEQAAAAQLERAGRTDGLQVRTTRQRAHEVVAVNRAFTDVFAVVLALALAIALASLGAGVVRAGRERRAELGVLRSLGLTRRAVLVELAAEPVLVVVVGLVVGAAVGIAVLRALFAVGYSDLPFVLPAAQLVGLAAGTVAVAALVCGLAAWPASRVSPDAGLADLG
ncbi:MAG TPA: FtsX-like permease family protein [Mycobacteriales bacterium]|nr:FtsX-like permease family protein [Mycobacteriales bacterium]